MRRFIAAVRPCNGDRQHQHGYGHAKHRAINDPGNRHRHMAHGRSRNGRAGSIGNRIAIWRAGMVPVATGFVSQPEPRSFGLFARGRQLTAGNVMFAGHLVEAPGTPLWDIPAPDPAFATEAQGFAWLDDLAAVGDKAAQRAAQDWTWGWIARHGTGTGPGWTPDLAGRRLIRWINHAIFLLAGRSKDQSDAYFRALTRQAAFVALRWQQTAPGLPRFEALSGMIYAGLALTGMERHVQPATDALARDCETGIDAQGGIPSRNPEDLLEVFALLIWAAQALTEAGRVVPAAHQAAIDRIAPCLRSLRHADGALARFHGGGRGIDGRLDQALASSGIKATAFHGFAMGFARLTGGRTSVISDVAAAPAATGHASTLGFELTSGRRTVIVNCGAGKSFGQDWHRAGRATLSHSTLAIDGMSSSRFGSGTRADMLTQRARVIAAHQVPGDHEQGVYAAHDGWSETHGLVHSRTLILSSDGRRLEGDDRLSASTPAMRARLETLLTSTGLQGVGFAIRFHLHPDAEPNLDLGDTAVSVTLKSTEVWVFRFRGEATLSLAPSVYLERGRLKPRATQAIVLTARIRDLEHRIGWTFAKAQDTPTAIRDFGLNDVPGN
jgi:uncharacterized heparinase superfamily protein